jgi:anti-sigma factor RsiW
MDCTEARSMMLALRRHALDESQARDVRDHIATCESCTVEDTADAALDSALERLAVPRAPVSVRASLEAHTGAHDLTLGERLLQGDRAPSSRRSFPLPSRALRPRSRFATVASAIAVLALAAVVFLVGRGPSPEMQREAVNDHLRVLYSEHPVEIESGGIHQVKPWFTGKLDFAPNVAFAGDADVPLVGGAVGYFTDRKAATYVYKRNLHVVTLFVFRAEGLPWATPATRAIGHAHGTFSEERGFRVFLWRDGDLGYALVSDLNEAELSGIAAKIAGP